VRCFILYPTGCAFKQESPLTLVSPPNSCRVVASWLGSESHLLAANFGLQSSVKNKKATYCCSWSLSLWGERAEA
jgi:hypothetical protein